MTIDKAIELLKELSIPGTQDLLPDDYDAIKLGREALKEVREARLMNDHLTHTLLPGETKE